MLNLNSIERNYTNWQIIKEGELFEAQEDAVIYKLYKFRERNSEIVAEKKDFIFERDGKLLCEACEF